MGEPMVLSCPVLIRQGKTGPRAHVSQGLPLESLAHPVGKWESNDRKDGDVSLSEVAATMDLLYYRRR